MYFGMSVYRYDQADLDLLVNQITQVPENHEIPLQLYFIHPFIVLTSFGLKLFCTNG